MISPREWSSSWPTTPAARAAGASKELRGLLVVTAGDRVGRVIGFGAHGKAVALGRSPECAVQFRSESVSRIHARLVRISDKYVVADADSTNGTYVNERRIKRATALDHGDQVRLGPDLTLRFSLIDAEEEMGLVMAAEGNDRDPLTGVFGRTYLEHALESEIAKATSKGTPLSVMMIDVDRFKKINDSLGHLAGDEVLAGLAREMRAAVRNSDILGRHGGDEFVLIAPGTPLEDAHCLGERLRCAVGTSPFNWRSERIRVTISVGVASLACCRADADRLALLFLADQRTYLAKRTRNAVVSTGGNPAGFMPSRTEDATQATSSG